MKIISTTLFAVICLCLLGMSQPAYADEECIDYAKPLAISARLLARSVAATTEALVAINKRANANEITSFDDFVDTAKERADKMVQDLDEKQQRIMERAEDTTDYTLCKQDLQDEIDALKAETSKAKAMLIELKDSIKDMLDELKGAFFG